MFTLENIVTAIVLIFTIGATVITVGILLRILRSEKKEEVENVDISGFDKKDENIHEDIQDESEEIDYNTGLLN